MNALEKIKLGSELKGLYKQITERTVSGLSAIQAGKRFKEVRKLLGFGKVEPVSDVKPNEEQFFAYNGEGATATKRQKANDQAVDIVELVRSGQLRIDEVTSEQKAILSQYSGHGGGLKNKVTGKTGSSYEYYTPKEIADGMWNLLTEMGFNGGLVLDPSAGTGVFSAVAPKNALMESVELDETSGTINKILFNDDNHKVTISPFETVASQTEDEIFDAVITNVPFGDTRGGNQFLDERYQDHNLEGYFILRSLDKLKPNGLAVFMSGPSIMVGKGRNRTVRELASQKAEFIGAYRLPNKLFHNAGADTMTDVLVFKKHSRANKAIIDELMQTNPVLLTQAKVLWEDFISGKYYQSNANNVLGTPSKVRNKFGQDVEALDSDLSVAEIAKLMRKLGGSRIDWDLLNTTDSPVASYQNGDIVYFDGVAKVYQDGIFQNVKNGERKADVIEQMQQSLEAYRSPLQTLEDGVDLGELLSLHQKFEQLNLSISLLPKWLQSLFVLIRGLSIKESELKNVIALLAFDDVRNTQQGQNTNYLERYPKLSATLQAVILGRNNAKWITQSFKDTLHVLKKTDAVLDRKTKVFSAIWQGQITQSEQKMLSVTQQYEKLLYEQGAEFGLLGGISKELFAQHFPDVDLTTDDRWCLSLDGNNVIASDDYYSGTFGDFRQAHEKAIAETTDEALKSKLIQQLNQAQSRLIKADPNAMSFDITSSFVSLENKVLFLNRYFAKNGGTFQINDKGDGLVYKYSVKNDEQAALQRLALYVTSHSFSTGAKTEEERSKRLEILKQKLRQANVQFSAWVKSNPRLMEDIEQRVNQSDALQFKSAENGELLMVEGINPNFKPRSHQSAYVRQQARSMGGICGFDVGLGKTFTALMTVQHLQSISVKKKTLFVVPNTTLTNWRKEAKAIYTPEVFEQCLFVGLREKNGVLAQDSKLVASDLVSIVENKHSKIFMTFEAFTAIRLATDTLDRYCGELSGIDSNYGASQNAKEDESNKGRLAKLVKELTALMDDKAEFLEKMGVDSLVIDEAHSFKNAKFATFGGRIKWLSVANPSARGLNVMVKTWYIRGLTPKNDGVLCLTATPITNSPLEIYSMLALTVGEERVQQLTGMKGADDFLENFCQIDYRAEETADGRELDTEVFTGLKNLDVLRKLLNSVATIKSVDDLPEMTSLVPNAEEQATSIALFDETKEMIEEFKQIYRIAKEETAKEGGVDSEAKLSLLEKTIAETGEKAEVLAHPFNFINKISKCLLDRDLAKGITKYLISDDQKEIAQKVVEQFNKLKLKEERFNLIGVSPEQIEKESFKTDKYSDDIENKIYTVRIEATLNGNEVILNTTDYNTQSRWLKLTEKAALNLDVQLSAKMAALLANVNAERANPKAKGGLSKQIIFCDMLGSHNKIKQMLVMKAGVPASKVVIFNAQSVADPADIQAIQDGFNADAEDNQYEILIANKKAEVGINLQKGTQAIHHLTVGWTPDSLQQRNGRGVRQGNYLDSVKIYHYDANGTFDSYKRRLVNSKANWIDSVMSGEGERVTISDSDSQMSRKEAEILANLIGDEEAFKTAEMELAQIAGQKRLNATRDELFLMLGSQKVQQSELANIGDFKDYLEGAFARIQRDLNVIEAEQDKMNKWQSDIYKADSAINHYKAYLEQSPEKEVEYSVEIGKATKKRSTAIANIERRKPILNNLWAELYRKYHKLFPALPEQNTSIDYSFNVKLNEAKKEALTQGENHYLYQRWVEEKEAGEAMLAGTEAKVKELAEKSQIPVARLEALKDNTALLIDNYPIMKGDFVYLSPYWYWVSSVDKEWRNDGVYFSVLQTIDEKGNVIACSEVFHSTLNFSPKMKAIEGDSEQAHEFYRQMAEQDQQSPAGEKRWLEYVPQVGQYIDPTHKTELTFDGAYLTLQNASINFVLTPEKMDEMKQFEPNVYQHLSKIYEEQGISYENGKAFATPLAQISRRSKWDTDLADFRLKNGYPIRENISLSTLGGIDERQIELDLSHFELDKVLSGQAISDKAVVLQRYQVLMVWALVETNTMTENIAEQACDGVDFIGVRLYRHNLVKTLRDKVVEGLALFEKRQAEAKQAELIKAREERIAEFASGILGEFIYLNGNTYGYHKVRAVRERFAEFVGLDSSQHIGWLKKDRKYATGDKVFFAQFDDQSFQMLPANSWILSKQAWELLSANDPQINTFAISAVSCLSAVN